MSLAAASSFIRSPTEPLLVVDDIVMRFETEDGAIRTAGIHAIPEA